jgi:hypothetical protein
VPLPSSRNRRLQAAAGLLAIVSVVAGRAACAEPAAAVPNVAVPEADIRQSVGRSLPFLEEKGVVWMKERACVTCHQTTFLIWTHGEAQRRGFQIDRRKLDEWTNWALLYTIAGLDSESNQSADTLSQFLLARDASSSWFDKPPKWPTGRTADPFENITRHLLKSQTAEGQWLAGGQSHNPPELPTAWAILALDSRDTFMNARFPKRETSASIRRLVEPNDKELPAARDKALKWLASQDPSKTNHLTERLVLRLLIDRRFGETEEADERLKELLGRQNADGGWSADLDRRQPSDAFATGMSLYALSLAGNGDEKVRTAGRRACQFLTSTQEKNGSWRVPSTAFLPSKGNAAREARTDEVFTYWGTAWATLGLLHTLPNPTPPASATSSAAKIP